MSEQKPDFNSVEKVKPPLEFELRNIAAELGYVETEEMQEMAKEMRQGADYIAEMGHYTDALDESSKDETKEENFKVEFMIGASICEAAIEISLHNNDAAFNSLADAADMLNNEQIHPEILAKIIEIQKTL